MTGTERKRSSWRPIDLLHKELKNVRQNVLDVVQANGGRSIRLRDSESAVNGGCQNDFGVSGAGHFRSRSSLGDQIPKKPIFVEAKPRQSRRGFFCASRGYE